MKGTDTSSVNGRGVVAHGDAFAPTGAFGFQSPSVGFGRSSEVGEGAAREQGAQPQTLEDLMATILRNAWQGEGTAAGSGTVWRDDVSARSARYVTRREGRVHKQDRLRWSSSWW